MAKGIVMTGRPTEFKEEYCDMLLKHMEQGLSYESFAGVVGVARSTIYHWEKLHPVFSDAKSRGQAQMMLTLERIGIQGMMGKIKGFNASTFIFTMKNKCGWSDVNQVDQTNTNIQISIDEDETKI